MLVQYLYIHMAVDYKTKPSNAALKHALKHFELRGNQLYACFSDQRGHAITCTGLPCMPLCIYKQLLELAVISTEARDIEMALYSTLLAVCLLGTAMAVPKSGHRVAAPLDAADSNLHYPEEYEVKPTYDENTEEEASNDLEDVLSGSAIVTPVAPFPADVPRVFPEKNGKGSAT